MLEGEHLFVDGSFQKPMRANIVANACSPDGRSVSAALKANDGGESQSLGVSFSCVSTLRQNHPHTDQLHVPQDLMLDPL
jgi:hypothetical protein